MVCDQQVRRDKRDVQQLGRGPLGILGTPIVALCGGDVGVAGELLHGADIRARVEQLPDEGTAQIVGREGGHVGAVREKPQAQQYRLRGHGACLDVSALGDGVEQRARPGAATRDPSLHGHAATGRTVDDALLATLAALDGDRALVVV